MLSFFLRTIVLLLFLSLNLFGTFASLTPNLCPLDQRDALIDLKTEFKIRKPDEFLDYDGNSMNVTSYPKTESWANSISDCCNWEGVTCDTKSGKVIGLDLSCSCLHGRLEPNSSLFQLQHLKSLNLAYNNFTLSPIPDKFNKLIWLETLNLSESSLKGHVPIELLQLTNLVSLDLSSSSSASNSYFAPPPALLLSIENPPLFLPLLARNLRNLRALDMSSVNISSEIPQEFSYMSSLRSLHLKNCYLIGEFPSSVFMIPNLQSIKLDHNPELRGELPVFSINNSMQVLSLLETSFSESSFSGRIPSSLGELSNLSSLVLFSNGFIGEVPSSIVNLKQLTIFSVGYNKLRGNFPSGLLNLTKLRGIDLGSNEFTGFFPTNIGQLSKLEAIFAGSNFFTGSVPASLFQISSLTHIYLEDNQFSDILGLENISMLPNLQYLFLHSKSFRISSPVDFNVFSSLKQLVGLALSGIPLSTANITSDSDFSSQFRYVYLSGCNITEFPEFIRDQRNLDSLDLSNNNIKGQLPDWLWRLEELQVVKLSNNSLSGFDGSLKAVTGSQINVLDLSSNAFQGPLFIPSTSITYLFVSNNNLTGELHYIGDFHDYGYYTSVVLMNKGVSMALERVTCTQLVKKCFHGTHPIVFGKPHRAGITGSIAKQAFWYTVSTTNCSAYEGNPGLYGPSLKDICGDIHAPTSLPVSEEEEEEEEEESLSWIAARIGFAPGIVFGLTIGYIVASYKHEWFMKIFGRNKHSFTHRSHSPKH
ncbi:hypothetical protein HID58_024852 [Brassica napus]|uniref:Leucine-rich repeat-containing N-terminal plant-type domain-containing protein n=1 Tax=Brassica napus TaxID=3708 RepID=A0ABQ8CJC2_BRANA|nr:hypothetical protein HID58_024852 [Brassica napus]